MRAKRHGDKWGNKEVTSDMRYAIDEIVSSEDKFIYENGNQASAVEVERKGNGGKHKPRMTYWPPGVAFLHVDEVPSCIDTASAPSIMLTISRL